MIDVFFDRLRIPDSCRLDKPLFKKLFLNNAELKAADKKALSEDVSGIRWRYTLKPSSTNISAFTDDDRDYGEVAILSVDLSSASRVKRLANFMQQAIPYPLLLVFQHEGKVALSVADKRINQADASKIVVEERWLSPWFDLAAPTEVEAAFLDAVTLSKLPATNFYALYQGLQAQIIAFIAAERTGQFQAASAKVAPAHRAALRKIDGLEREIAELRNALKRESQMARKISLNSEIKSRKDVIVQLEAELTGASQ